MDKLGELAAKWREEVEVMRKLHPSYVPLIHLLSANADELEATLVACSDAGEEAVLLDLLESLIEFAAEDGAADRKTYSDDVKRARTEIVNHVRAQLAGGGDDGSAAWATAELGRWNRESWARIKKENEAKFDAYHAKLKADREALAPTKETES